MRRGLTRQQAVGGAQGVDGEQLQGGGTVDKDEVVAVEKGGVGKTTTTVNITAALHELGKRVLLCDFDPQANATSGMGVDKNTASPNVYDLLVSDADPARAVGSGA